MTQARRRWLLLGLCAAVLLPRAYVAVADAGMVWSDEIFQSVEQGHRLAFGYGFLPWEFKVGARSWLLPGAIGGLLKVLAILGVGSGAGLVVACKLTFALLAAAAFYPMLRFAQALGGVLALVLLGLVGIAFPASLLYSSRVLSEVASAPFLAWGLWLLLPWGMAGGEACSRIPRGRARRLSRLLFAGGCLGLAALLRYQNAVLLPVIVLIVAVRRGPRPAAWLVAGVVGVLLGGGLLDWLTWGRPFHSLLVYLRFNLVESGANQWGVSGRDFYPWTMLLANGPAVLVLVLGFLAGLRRTWPVALLVALYVVALSAIAHKELRFLTPVLPLFLACAALGLARLLARLPFPPAHRRASAWALGLAVLLGFGARVREVTFRDIGQPMPPPSMGGPTSKLVWGAFGERNRLFVKAAGHADLCGLVAPAMNPYWTGGYAYLHRRVPLVWAGSWLELAAANYAIVGPGQRLDDARYQAVAQDGPYQLLKRAGACTPPPRGSTGYGRLTVAGVPGV
jgi:GPI mannosyltransferase 3